MKQMTSDNTQADMRERSRLVLVVPALDDAADQLAAALAGGDVASIVIVTKGLEPPRSLQHCQTLVNLAQERGVAVLVAEDTQLMGRCGADGVFFSTPGNDFRDKAARFSPHRIVGFGGARERHRALELGNANPDFLFFGKLDGDIRPQPHPKNLALAHWWSEMIEIPCVVMGGSELQSVVDCTASGAEFVALGLAVFGYTDGPEAAVREANRLVDETFAALEVE